MKRMCWVYIIKNKTDDMTVGFAVDMDKTLIGIAMRRDMLFYLRPFEEPFDALAHKHLLDTLSNDTVKLLIQRSQQQTERYKNLFRGIHDT